MSKIARFQSRSSTTKHSSKLPGASGHKSSNHGYQSRSRSSSFDEPAAVANGDGHGNHAGQTSMPPGPANGSCVTDMADVRLSPNLGIRRPSVTVKTATVRNVYVERDFTKKGLSTSQSSSSSGSIHSSGQIVKPKVVTSRSKVPSRHTTFGKNASRERSPGESRLSRKAGHYSSQKRHSLESETASSSDYYEDVRILSIRNNIQRAKQNGVLPQKVGVLSSMETSSETQSESDNYADYDDVGIPGLRPSRSSLEPTSCDSESDSHNYEEIGDYRPVHNYEEIEEFIPEQSGGTAGSTMDTTLIAHAPDSLRTGSPNKMRTPEIEHVECCEPAEQEQIYTDWANHYLEKARYKRTVTDLQTDICDGVLLADIVHAVTNQRVPSISSKPKTSAQMTENLNQCLVLLTGLGVNIDGLSSTDLREGNLKAILSLFFALSRYKQQQKQGQGQAGQLTAGTYSSPQLTGPGPHTDLNANATLSHSDMLSRLPSPFTKPAKGGGGGKSTGTARIPGGAPNVNRRTSGASDPRTRNAASPAHTGVRSTSARDSVSPNTSLSGIPAPGSQSRIRDNRGTNSAGNIQSQGPAATHVARAQSVQSASSSEVNNKNNSMLEKFKFFKDKDKGKAGSKAAGKSGASAKGKDGSKGVAANGGAAPQEEAPQYANTAALKAAKKSTSKASKKDAAALQEQSKKTGSASSIPGQYSGRASSNSSVNSTGSNSRRALAQQPGGRSDSSLKDAQRSATSSASRLAQSGIPDRSALPKAKGSVSASSFSSIPATSGASIPRPGGAKPPKSGSKVKSSQSRESLSGQPARRSASMSAASPPLRSPQLAPGARAPPGMPQSRPPQAHISFLAQVQRAHAQAQAQQEAGTALSSASTPTLRQATQSHTPRATQPTPPPREDSLKPNSTPVKHKPDSDTKSTGVETQTQSHSVKSSTTQSSPAQSMPVGQAPSLQSASYTGLSPSKVPFPSIPEEPPPKPKKVDSDTQTNVSAVASAKHNTARQIQNNLVSASMPHLRLASAQSQLKVNPSYHMKQRTRSPKQVVSAGVGPSGVPMMGSPRPQPVGAPAAPGPSSCASVQGVSSLVAQQPQSSPHVSRAQGAPHSPAPPVGMSPSGAAPSSAFVKPTPRRTTDAAMGLRDHSNSSINHSDSNVSTASESNVSNSSSSKSNSGNNSASSTDSVIFRPSSCDELESGMESDANIGPRSPQIKVRPTIPNSLPTTPVTQPMDHISSLRKKQQMAQEAMKKSSSVDGDRQPPMGAGTPARRESTEDKTMDGIKPMQPIARSTPYNLLQRNGTPASPSLIRNLSLNNGLASPHSAASRLGVNRPLIDPAKLISNQMRRAAQSVSVDGEYGSDIDGYDVTAGYMSDGDILKSNKGEEMSSGYISEGGASMYAKRLQQRFREGMIAVQECMQKSAAQVVDYDSFEDSSSISSGDISDTINDISTDDITTGSSLSGDADSANQHAYHSLKQGHRPPAQQGDNNYISRSLPNRSGSFQAGGINWKKYAIGDSPGGSKPYQHAIAARKASQAADSKSGTAVAIDDPHFGDSGAQVNGHHHQHHHPAGGKVDSETNTEQTILMMRKQQGYWAAAPGQAAGQYHMRRPSAPLTGERLSNYRALVYPRPPQNMKTLGNPGAVYIMRGKDGGGNSDMGPEAYSANTLEKKRRAQMAGSVSSSQNGSADYPSNSLGRRRPGETIKDKLFGSRSSLNKMQNSDNGNMSSTIISNPHATYGRVTDASPTGSTVSTPGGRQHYVNMYMTTSADGIPARPLSAMSSPVGAPGWIKSSHGMVANGMRSAMSETESMECLHNSIQAQIQQAKALAQASRNILAQNHHYTQSLQRSDSFKSTRSERIYANTSQAHTLPRTGSCTQLSPNGEGPAPSPTPSHASQASAQAAFAYPAASSAPYSAAATSPYTSLMIQSKLSNSKDNDLHGSALSLVSSSSSVYSTAEDKYQHEIRKLRRDLESAQDKVATLTTQLSTNAHVVSAFEQSLSNMTHRLQQLTSTAEQKDNEVTELRMTIEAIRQQTGISYNPDLHTHSAVRRQSSNVSSGSKQDTSPDGASMRRQMSAESMSSITSMSSACSATSQQSAATDTTDKRGRQAHGKKKGGNWLRSSFSKAFSRSSSSSKKPGRNGSVSDVDPDSLSMRSDASLPNTPMPHSVPNTPVRGSASTQQIYKEGDESTRAVHELQQRLHEKDMKLTDTQLEALSSAAQLEQLRDTMNRMKLEMSSLKADNSRLQKIVTDKGISVSASSVPATPSTSDPPEKRLSLGDPSKLDDILLTSGGPGSPERSGQAITISVFLAGVTDVTSHNAPSAQAQMLIGSTSVSGKTKWDMLDTLVKRSFKEYCLRVDPVTNLGLSSDSVLCYHIGDQITRSKESPVPELLPCGYLVGDTTNITVALRGTSHNSVDALAFETLIPKSIVQRYISLLLEHRRIILCGPTGTGKSYLAHKIAEYLVVKSGKELGAGAIATFNVDHKSSKELRQYLANIAEQCEHSAADLPNVIILDNLHHVGSLGEVFNGFLRVKYQQCPYIIGTMNQATCSTTNLQLHHNFRWVLCANHMEPVKGFLGRYLRRKLVEEEVKSGTANNELCKMMEWIPQVWQHLNKFLETHSSSEVTVGPRLFLSCPMDVGDAQVWFTDLWNYSIVPYLLEAVREGIQTYGHRAPWEDPSDWIRETYPFARTNDPDWPNLLKMRPEDVGYDAAAQSSGGGTKSASQSGAQSDAEADPLLNMLMRLQEAASYSSPQSGESDSASMDNQSVGSQPSGVNMESTL